MKPLVFYDFEVSKENLNKVVIWRDKLDELLEKVYEAGYNDGLKDKENPVIVTRQYIQQVISNSLASSSTKIGVYGNARTEFE